ncbi:MAG: Hsp20/alpha crystallin family protein [Chloroflexi bacterium]|nr:Hsp20/alpha crystallin family protein [Chloroflexota bacterium]
MIEQTLPPVVKPNGTTTPMGAFAMLERLEHEMEDFWDRPFFFGAGPWPVMFPPIKAAGKMAFAPRTDVYDKGDVLVVKAEMPGMKKEDVTVELYEGDLVIAGKTKAEQEVAKTAYYRMERTFGSFYRRLPLPFEVKPDQVTATLVDGILEIQIPKTVATTPAATTIPVA